MTTLRSLALSLCFIGACTQGAGSGDAGPKPAEKPPAPPATPAEPALPGAEKLLADSVEAMGGAAKFDALRSYYAESQLSMGGLGLTGVAKTWWRGGDFYNETEMPGVGQMKVGSLGGKAWADDPINGPRALGGKESEQAAWSATLCLAHEWKRHFKTAETTGVKEVDGKKLAEITLTSALGDKVVMRIDMASKLPVSQSFTQVNPMGELPATVTFEDFRKVDGVTIAFKQVVDASLTKAVSTTTKVELNAPVEEAKFAMPGADKPVTPGALVDAAKIDPTKPAEPEKDVARTDGKKGAKVKAPKPDSP